jgi:AcrR family transcriptional regulator
MATRHGTVRPAQQYTKERVLDAALKVLKDAGVAGLTVRSVAEAAGASTIAVYTRFGGRTGLLDTLYERAFDLLHEKLGDLPPPSNDYAGDILAFAMAYRRFALENPARYALMFERPVPDYTPDPALRVAVLQQSFGLLVSRVERCSPHGADNVKLSFLLFTTMHGLVSNELTQQARGPIPGWFLRPTEDANEPMFLDGISAMIVGLGFNCG